MHSKEKQEGNEEKIARLKDFLAQGFYLHGSKSRLSVIEPRQATDENPNRVAGKAHAIYAEDRDIRIPIFKALFAENNASLRSWRASYSAHGPDSLMKIGGENCTLTSGYVHVLPPDTFETEEHGNDRELISRDSITPIEIIDVDASIVEFLQNIEMDLN